MPLFSFISFLGAFLLFQIELLAGKTALSHYGGSYFVWGGCLLFFQILLLLGYLYVFLMSRYAKTKIFLKIHIAVLILSLFLLPSSLSDKQFFLNPSADLLTKLFLFIGFPFFMLSTASTFTQRLFSQTADFYKKTPYSLYGWSNIGSILGLITFPILFEIYFPNSANILLWKAGYVVFVLFHLGFLRFSLKQDFDITKSNKVKEIYKGNIFWLLIPFATAAMLVSFTNFISFSTASIPFVWMIMLVIYLASFVIYFMEIKLSKVLIYILSAAVLVISFLAFLNQLISFRFLYFIITSFVFAFLCCLGHKRLYFLRPKDNRNLPKYYLFIALGSVLGTLLINIIVPLTARNLLVKNIDISVSVLIFVVIFDFALSAKNKLAKYKLASIVTAGALISINLFSSKERVYLVRNFYGVSKVVDKKELNVRFLVHGNTLHSAQFLSGPDKNKPISYYGENSPIGDIIKIVKTDNTAVIGLGAGTMAALFSEGKKITFYELDEDVIKISKKYFTYLENSKADISIKKGDGRLLVSKEPNEKFDLIILDAFNSENIPSHLLTKEALLIYKSKLKGKGLILFHISNDVFNLAPILTKTANAAGFKSAYKTSSCSMDKPLLGCSKWFAATENKIYMSAMQAAGWNRADISYTMKEWTDDYTNLLSHIKIF